MHPLFRAERLGRLERARLGRILRAGPWCWPSEDDEDALGRARAASGLAAPPALFPGAALLVSVSPRGAALWRLEDGGGASDRALAYARFVRAALRSWEVARAALPASVPVLWRSVHEVARAPRALHIETRPGPRETGVPDLQLDGPSFGLAFFLALASAAFETPLAGDFVASATIDESGAIGPVDGIEEKIAAIAELAPRVSRFFVAREQAEGARAAARGSGIEVIPVESAAAALALLLPDLRAMVVESGATPEKRAELVRSFFALALGERKAAVDWTPIAEGAALALETWPDLAEDDRARLDFARNIALRHQGNRGRLAIPDERWLASLNIMERLACVSHVVEHAADTGTPSAGAAEALADRYLVPAREAFPEHLKILGAKGRLLAVTGRPEEALACQREAAAGWRERGLHAQASYPLAECFRLSGALEDREAFEEAEELWREIETRAPGDLAGAPYVRLARGKALVFRGEAEAARADLAALIEDRAAPLHVRWSALRWLAAARPDGEPNESAEGVRASVESAARGDFLRAELARRVLALIALDRALARGDERAAEAEVRVLETLQPGILGHLCAAAERLRKDAARYVQRFYPY